MESQVIKNFIGANIYCDSPALLVEVDRRDQAAGRDIELNQFLVKIISAVAADINLHSNYKVATQTIVAPPLNIPTIHIWLYKILAEMLNATPDIIRLISNDQNSYQAIISWQTVDSITYDLFRYAMKLVEMIVQAFRAGNMQSPDSKGILNNLREFEQLQYQRGPDQTATGIINECLIRGIPVRKFMPNSRFYQLGLGAKRTHIMESCSSETSLVAQNISRHKVLTNELLAEYRIPCPRTFLIANEKMAIRVAEQIGYPVVVKPAQGKKGVGITVGACSAEEVLTACRKANTHGSGVLIESYLPGDDHRILVVDGKVIAVAKRLPAQVLGNGQNSISELIEIENQNPNRGDGFDRLMQKIIIDDELMRMLQRQSLSLESIPAQDLVIQLKGTANISTGGHAEDKTDLIHPDNKCAAESAAKIIGANITGVDFISPDISCSYKEIGGGICEMNMGPGLRPHDIANPNQNLFKPIVDSYFGGDDGRIPLAAITGTNGKTTTANMLDRILTVAGYNTGVVTTNGIYIGGEEIRAGDSAGAISAKRVLVDPTVEAAVLEVARGGILKTGLGFDRSLVSAVTNVSNDHIGLDSVGSIAEMAKVKAVVANSSTELTVLNADDPHCMGLVDKLKSKRICFVTANEKIESIAGIAREGNCFCSVKNESEKTIELCGCVENSGVVLRVKVNDLICTRSGVVKQNIQNAQFAIALAYGMGVPVNDILNGIKSFRGDINDNRGRSNIYDGFPFPVIMDYAHNVDSLTCLSDVMAGLRPGANKTLVFALASNRHDSYYEEIASTACDKFDVFYLYTGGDNRVRTAEETRNLFRDELMKNEVDEQRIQLFPNELEAIEYSLKVSCHADVLSIVTDDFDAVWKLLLSYRR